MDIADKGLGVEGLALIQRRILPTNQPLDLDYKRESSCCQ